MEPHDRPLKGTRVLDFGEVMAGPFCAAVLADLGAEVIKIESVRRLPALTRGGLTKPSEKRRYGYPGGMPGERPHERYVLFHNVERNKLGITLDVASAEGNGLFRELIRRSDALVSNYAGASLERLGFPYSVFEALNPRFVLTLLPAFGATGPYKERLAFGPVSDLVSGHASVRGYRETAPYDTPNTSLPDSVGALHAALATLVAMGHARRTGRGQLIDLAHTEAMLQHLGEFLARAWLGQATRPRGNREPWAAPSGCYPCAEDADPGPGDPNVGDRWVAVSVRTDAQWEAFTRTLGREELLVDPRFATLIHRKRNEDALDEAVAAATRRHDRWALAARLRAAGVAAVAVPSSYDLSRDEGLFERGVLELASHPYAGVQAYLGPMFGFAHRQMHVERPPNTLGQDNAYVFGDVLGLPAERMEALEAAGVIGTEYRVDDS